MTVIAIGDRAVGRFGSDVRFAVSGIGAPIQLPRNGRLFLDMRVNFSIASLDGPDEHPRAETTASTYRLLDSNGAEFLAYHWHPIGASPVTWPHVHVGRVETRMFPSGDRLALAEAHLPTGMVSFAGVVRLLIDDLGVVPRRSDWRAILDETDPTGSATPAWRSFAGRLCKDDLSLGERVVTKAVRAPYGDDRAWRGIDA